MGSKKILVFAIIFTVLSVIFGIVSIVVLIHPSDAYSYIDELVYNEGIIAKKIEYSGTYSDIYIENSDVCLSVLHQTVENQSPFDRLQSGDKIIFGLDKEGQDKFENGEREVVLNKSKRINVFVNRSVSESYLQDRLSDGFKYLSITTQTYCR